MLTEQIKYLFSIERETSTNTIKLNKMQVFIFIYKIDLLKQRN